MQRGGLWRCGAVVVVAMALLSGCWSQIGFGPEHRRHNDIENVLTTATVDSLTESWSVDVDGNASELVTSDGRAYTTVTGPNGVHVLAVDLDTGEELWRTALVDTSGLDPKPIVNGAPVTVSRNLVRSSYYSYESSAGRCHAKRYLLNRETGAVAQTTGELSSPVATSHNMVVDLGNWITPSPEGTCTGRSTFLLTRGSNGSDAWVSARVPGSPASPFDLLFMPPAIVDDRIVVANGSTVSMFPFPGCGADICADPAWSVDIGVSLANTGPVGGESGQIYLSPTGGPFLALSAESSAELWRLDVGAGQKLGVAVADGFVFLSRSRGSANRPPAVEVYDGTTGARVGSTSSTTAETVTAPTIAGGVLYRGTTSRVDAFDAAACTNGTCSVVGSVDLPARPRAISVANGQLLVAGNGYITAYRPD